MTLFTDSKATIRWMAPDEPVPSQVYAIQARKSIAVLTESLPGIARRSGGARPTRGSQETRNRMRGQGSLPRSPALTGCNGYDVRIGSEGA